MIKVEIGAKAGNYDFDMSDIDMNEIWDIAAHRPEEVDVGAVKNGVFSGTIVVAEKGKDADSAIEIEGKFNAKAYAKNDYDNFLVSVSSLTVIEQGVESYTISGLDLSSADIKSNKTLAAYLKGETVQITGNDRDNELSGSAGKEAFVGGNGDDVYYVTDKDTVKEGSGKDSGDDTVVGSGALDLSDYKNVENLIGGKTNDDLTGTSGNNTIEGGAGDDTLDGNGGKDVLNGGAGDDTYFVGEGKAQIKESSGKGSGEDTVVGSGVISLEDFKNVENLEGGRQDDKLTGNSEDNIIDGGRGADRMSGGAGDDLYIVDNAKDIVVEADKKGHDTVETSVSFDLGKFKLVEDLFLVGKANIDATGGDNDNTLEGNAGDNELEGGRGDDELTGGDGDDLFIFNRGDDQDVITDFDAKGSDHEVIEVNGYGSKLDFEDLKISATKNGVEVDFGKGDSIFLEGVKIKDVDASDFQF
jgi:Ca2+-binding RTX toxin-like protein